MSPGSSSPDPSPATPSDPGTGNEVELAQPAELPARQVINRLRQIGGVRPLLRRQVALEVYGLDELGAVYGAAVLVANHASSLDTAVLLAALPEPRRRRAVVAVAHEPAPGLWRLVATRLGLETRSVDPSSEAGRRKQRDLLAAGGTVVAFPDGPIAPDGFGGGLPAAAVTLAATAGVPLIPIGIRGSYSATPQGGRPVRSRPRVSVRFGAAVHRRTGESEAEVAARVMAGVRRLVAEDATTWWQVQRTPEADLAAPAASWRRIWEQTAVPVEGARPRRAKIWRR